MNLPAFVSRICLLFALANLANISAQLSVEKDHLACAYGLKNQQGNWVVPAVYVSIYQTPHNNFIALDGIHYGVLTSDGKPLVPFEFTHIDEKTIERTYQDRTKTWQHTLLFITRNMNNCGVCNVEGEEIIPVEYENIVLDGDHLLLYRLKNLKKCSSYADQSGKFLFQDISGFVYPFSGKSSALLAEREYGYYDNVRAYGLIDTLGNVIIPMTYNHVNFCKDGFLVQLQGKTGLIDADGKILHEPRYSVFTPNGETCLDQQKTYIIIDPENNKYGFMKGDFNVLAPPVYEKIELLHNLYKTKKISYSVQLNGKTGMADENGNITIQPLYENLIPLAYRIDAKAELNKSGKPKKLQQKYITKDHFICQKNGKYGLISEDGQTLFEAEFDFFDWGRSPLFGKENKLFSLEYNRTDPQMTEIPLVFNDDSLYLFFFRDYLVPLYMTKRNPHSFTKFDYIADKRGELYYIDLIYMHKTAVYDSKGQKLPFNNIKKLHNEDEAYLVFSFGAEEDKLGVLHSGTGKLLIDTAYQWIEVFAPVNQIWAGNYNPITRKKEWIVFDTLGKQRIDVVFDQIQRLGETLIVRTGNRAGLLDKNLQWLIPPAYLEIQKISPNFHIAITPGRHIGLFDDEYRLASDTIYTDFLPVSSKSMTSRKKESWWMLKNGHRRLLFNSNCRMLDETKNAVIDSLLINLALVNGTFEWNASDHAFRIGIKNDKYDLLPSVPFKKEMYSVLHAIYEKQLRYPELGVQSNSFLSRDSMAVTDALLLPFTTQKTHTGDSLSSFGLLDLGWKYMVVLESDFTKNSIWEESDHPQKRIYRNYVWQNSSLLKISIKDIFGTGNLLESELLFRLPSYGSLRLNCSTPALMVQEIGEKFSLSDSGILLYLLSAEGEYVELLIPVERLQLHAESSWIVEYLTAER